MTDTPNPNWLDRAPFPAMALDENGKVCWFNAAFEDLCSLNGDEITGRSASEPPLPELAVVLGNESSFKLYHPERGNVWIERQVIEVNDDEQPAQQVHFFQYLQGDDKLLAENQRLQQQVDNLTLTDELTGLANERSLSQHLANQVTRSRRYHNPLTLALLSLETNDQGAHILDEEYDSAILSFSHFLRERLRWADFIARCDAGRFIVVLPETGKEEARRLFEDIVEDSQRMELPDVQPGTQPDAITVRYGLAGWEKGDDPKQLVEKAAQALG